MFGVGGGQASDKLISVYENAFLSLSRRTEQFLMTACYLAVNKCGNQYYFNIVEFKTLIQLFAKLTLLWGKLGIDNLG